MSTAVTVKGVAYTLAQDGDKDYGAYMTTLINAMITAYNNTPLQTNVTQWDAVVSDTAARRTHATLEAVIADGAVAAGSNVLIDSATFTQNATLDVSKKLYIYGIGNSTFEAGAGLGANPIIQFSVSGSRFQGIALDANGNAPTYAVQVDAAVMDIVLDIEIIGAFATDDIDNQSTDEAIVGFVKELTGNYLLPVSVPGANSELSNLAGTGTAINEDLIYDTDNTYDFGSDALEAKDIWTHGINHNDAVDTDLTIQTSGNNGNILLTPNGAGVVQTSKIDINGGAIDAVTLGTNSPVTEAQVDNININGNTISSTDVNGNVTITPNGTGYVKPTNLGWTYNAAITAFAGGGQANATQIAAQYNIVSVCATADDSVKLPATFDPGVQVVIKNTGAERCAVYPSSGDTIEGMAADVSVHILPNQSITFIGQTANSAWLIDGGFEQEVTDGWVTVNSPGTASQIQAGHEWVYTDLDSELTDFTTIASYSFINGAGLVTDDVGTYTLTNNNAATAANGIMGSGYATDLDEGSAQSYSVNLLLDTPPANLIMATWLKADDGQYAANMNFLSKCNVANEDEFYAQVNTSGHILWYTEEGNNGGKTLTASTVFPNGQTGWYFVVLNWDTVNGKRMWINGVLEAVDSSATTLMGADVGAGSDFYIGAYNDGSLEWNGQMGQTIIANGTLTQRDVDWLYSTLIPEPAVVTGKEYTVYEKIRPAADVDFEYEEKCQVIAKQTLDDTNSYILRQGRSNGSTDSVKIIGRVN